MPRDGAKPGCGRSDEQHVAYCRSATTTWEQLVEMISSRGREVLSTIDEAAILEDLKEFDPAVVGTFPLGLERSGSDVDILCFADDLQAFIKRAQTLFSDRPRFSAGRRTIDDQPEAAVVRFTVGDVPVELFAQPIPTTLQRGFQHFEVERRLLKLGGQPLARRVRDARRDGDSVEVAFAEVLELGGDPFTAVLELRHETDAELRERIADSLGHAEE